MKAKIRVRMNRTAKGAPDSVTVTEYVEGREYDLPEDLAECFFSDGTADPAEAHEPPPAKNKPAPSPGHGSGGETPPPAKKRKGRAS